MTLVGPPLFRYQLGSVVQISGEMMLHKLFDFLFGKAPDIFDEDGKVVHKFPPQKWQAWNDRFNKSSDYDWRQHKGTERKIKSAQPTPPLTSPPK